MIVQNILELLPSSLKRAVIFMYRAVNKVMDVKGQYMQIFGRRFSVELVKTILHVY